jgi:uncharacterized membrane protein (DUF106 family)
MQIAGVTPHYTTHPIFPNLFTAMIVASLIAIGLNFVFSMLRKKTTDIEKMSKVMKETTEWRKQYTDAIKKQDNQIDNNGEPLGPCSVPGEVYLWGWFLITNFAFSGIVSKITKTSMPSIT